MFSQNRNKKEYFSLRKFKGVGLTSALVGLAILGSGSVSADEITRGVTRDGGVTTITADGATIKLKDAHVTVYNKERNGLEDLNALNPSFNGFDKAATAEKEKQVLATEESNLTGETTENHGLTGDVTVDYKTKDNETVKDTSTVAANTVEGVDTEKEVTSAVRGNFGRVIKGADVKVDDDKLKQGLSSSDTVSPTKLVNGSETYHKIDTRIDENKLEYSKNIEMNDVREQLTTQKLHNEDGSVNYANIKNGSKVWVVEELEDGSYGRFTTITKTDATNNESVISDFTNALPNAQKFTDANVKAAGGIQKPDYLLVLERNTFARVEAVASSGITGLFFANDVFNGNESSLVPNSDSLDSLKNLFAKGFLSKLDAQKRVAELKKQPNKLEVKDSEGRPTKNWTLEIGGSVSTDYDTTTYEDTASFESALNSQESKFYSISDAINGEGAYKGTPIPLVGERKLVGSNKDLTVDYIWDHSTGKPATLTPELRSSLEKMIARVNEDKAKQTSAIYETEVPEGVKFERIVVEFENDANSFTWKQKNGEYEVTVFDNEGNNQTGSGFYGEYTVNGQKHRVRISNMNPFSVQPLLNGLYDTEYNDIFMVNRAYKKVDSSAHVTNIYAKEQRENTEIRGTTTVKYVDEEGNTLKEDVVGPDGLVKTEFVDFYINKEGQRVDVRYGTIPSKNTYDVSTEQYKPTSLEKEGKVYGYVRTDGEETGKLVEGNTVITYVYKMKKAPLSVNYYIENTTTSLAPSENQADLPVKSDYTTQSKEIPSKTEVQDLPEKTVTTVTTYELVATPDNANGKIAEGGTTVNYFYRAVEKVTEVAKQAPVVVNHYLEGTETKLADSVDQGQKNIGSNYTTEAVSVPNKVEVQDLDDRVVTKTTSYELVSEPTDKNGQVPVGGKVVNYYYRAVVKEDVVMKKAPVVANYYLEGTTTKLADSDNQGEKEINSKYTTESKEITPKVEVQDLADRVVTKTTTYELVSEPTDKKGQVPVGGKVVDYFYRAVVKEDVVMKKAPVLVNYYIENTVTKLADSDNQGEKEIGSKYTSEKKAIEPKTEVQDLADRVVTKVTTYELVAEPTDKEGVVPVGGKIVNYYYRPVVKETVVMKKAPVLVNYYEDGTTTKLAESDNKGEQEIGSKYSSEKKEIAPKVEVQDLPEKTVTTTTTYTLKEVPSDAEGIVPVGGKVVNYYYVKNVKVDEVAKKAPVVANYYLEGTTTKLADSDNKGEQAIGSAYTTSVKTIESKVVVEDTAEKKVTRTTSYELVSVPSDKDGKVPVGGKVVNYYYREVIEEDVLMKKAPVVANYYLEGTTTKLADSDNQGDKQIGSNYSTEVKGIAPKTDVQDLPDKVITKVTTYELVETPKDKDGQVPVGGKVVNYYYKPLVKGTVVKKQAPVVAHYYLEGTTTKLASSVELGKRDIGSNYATDVKRIEPKTEVQELADRVVTKVTTYELVSVPKDAEGLVSVGGKVVTYYYKPVVKEEVKMKASTLIVNHLLEGTDISLSPSEVTSSLEINSDYKTKPVTIPSKLELLKQGDTEIARTTIYELVSTPQNASGKISASGVVVNYYYKPVVTEKVTKILPKEEPKVEQPKVEVPKETPKVEVPKETVKEELKAETPKQAPRSQEVKELPNTGMSDSANLSALGMVGLLGLLGLGATKRKED